MANGTTSSGTEFTYQDSDLSYIRGQGITDTQQALDYIYQYGASGAGVDRDLSDASRTAVVANFNKTNDKEAADSDLQTYLEAMRQASAENLASSYDYAKQARQDNVNNFSDYRGRSLRGASNDAPLLNRLIESEFQGALDRLLPSWRQDIVGAAATAQGDSVAVTRAFRERVMPKVMKAAGEMSAQAISYTQSLMQGDISDEARQQLARTASELQFRRGSYGPGAENEFMKSLSTEVMSRQQQGLTNAQGALGLASSAYGAINQTLQMPVQTGANITNALAPYRAPLVDPASMYQNALGMLMNAGTVSPNTALQTGAQVGTQFASMGQNQAQFTTQAGSQAYWNQMNYGMQQQAIKASQGGGGFSLGGALAGGLAGIGGGAPGIAAGAAAGGFAPMLA